jgi:hypothetical protein
LVAISINPVNQLLSRPWSIPNDSLKVPVRQLLSRLKMELHSWHKNPHISMQLDCMLISYQFEWTKAPQPPVQMDKELFN